MAQRKSSASRSLGGYFDLKTLMALAATWEHKYPGDGRHVETVLGGVHPVLGLPRRGPQADLHDDGIEYPRRAGLPDAPAGRSACWAVQTSRHARQQSNTDQQISFRNR